MLVRQKTASDEAQCVDLLLQVHQADGYPLYLPQDVPAFITPKSRWRLGSPSVLVLSWGTSPCTVLR